MFVSISSFSSSLRPHALLYVGHRLIEALMPGGDGGAVGGATTVISDPLANGKR